MLVMRERVVRFGDVVAGGDNPAELLLPRVALMTDVITRTREARQTGAANR